MAKSTPRLHVSITRNPKRNPGHWPQESGGLHGAILRFREVWPETLPGNLRSSGIRERDFSQGCVVIGEGGMALS